METQKITSELLATGLTQQELGDLIECSQSTVAAFANGTRGKNPTYAIATRLLELHAERCPALPASDTVRAPHAPAPP
jgi:transcriptional regulator with XRE-family HTH domain